MGVFGVVNARRVLLGTVQLLTDQGIDCGVLPARADELRRNGQTVVLVAIDGMVAGLLGVSDPIKASTLDAIRLLHERHEPRLACRGPCRRRNHTRVPDVARPKQLS